MVVSFNRAALELGRGRDAEGRAGERLAGLLAAPNPTAGSMRAFQLQIQVRLGETEQVEQVLAGLSDQDRDRGENRIVTGMLRLAPDDPHAALAALAPILDASVPLSWPTRLIQAFLLEASARDTLGDSAAAGRRGPEPACRRAGRAGSR